MLIGFGLKIHELFRDTVFMSTFMGNSEVLLLWYKQLILSKFVF